MPRAGCTSCHLPQQVSMTFLFKGSHPSSDCYTPLWGLQPSSHLLASLSYSNNADAFLWVACQICNPQKNQECCIKTKRKTKGCLF
jgi:hypothetical protein